MAVGKIGRSIKYIFVSLTLVITIIIALLIINDQKSIIVNTSSIGDPLSGSSETVTSSTATSSTVTSSTTVSSEIILSEKTTSSELTSSKASSSITSTSSANSSTSSQITVTPTTTAEKKAYVKNNSSNYTDGLIEFMGKYDEVIDYVYDYPKYQNNVTPSTLSESFGKGTFPLLIQWDSRWGYQKYSTSLVGVSGCGPTAVTMVYAGLTGKHDETPGSVADLCVKYGYYTPGSGTSWSLMTEGVKKLGLSSQQLTLSKSNMTSELAKGRPLICSVRPGDFTTSGHFIVITGYSNGNFTVNDPNSRINSAKTWDYETLGPQIKNLWSFWEA